MRGKWARRVWLPAELQAAIAERIDEVREETLSRYLVELISYDLRERRRHSLTGPLGAYSPEVQQAINLAIRCHYKRGQKSHKDQMFRVIARGIADQLCGLRPEPLMKKIRHEVYLRRMHSGIMAKRMKDLGFTTLSEYVLSLVRYDLLVGGPHTHYGGPCSKEMRAELDKMTHTKFHTTEPKKCMIDYLVEDIAGREMTPEERDEALRKVSEQFVAEAIAAQKQARKAG